MDLCYLDTQTKRQFCINVYRNPKKVEILIEIPGKMYYIQPGRNQSNATGSNSPNWLSWLSYIDYKVKPLYDPNPLPKKT